MLVASTGKPELVIRAELVRCAARVAALVFDACAGFDKLRQDAGRVQELLSDRAGWARDMLVCPPGEACGGARRLYPLSVQPGRYVRRSRALASGTFVTRPDAPSYSIFWPVRYATCASSICSHRLPL